VQGELINWLKNPVVDWGLLNSLLKELIKKKE
jgi:hypothetical protein